MFESAVDAIKKLQETSGAIAKKKIIEENKENGDFCKLLFYALNPLITYNISEQTLRKPMPFHGAVEVKMRNIFDVCESLSKRRGLDDATVYQVKLFVSAQPPELRELYIGILSKTLRLGVKAKTVNQVIPGLIPDWEIQQAYAIDKHPIKDDVWFSLTQKLNGVRATYCHGKLYARSGDVYEGLDHIIDELEGYSSSGGSVVYDGELTLIDNGDMTDNEAFRTATGLANSDVGTDKSALCFNVFDILPADEFEQGESKQGYKKRREFMDFLNEMLFKDSKYVRILPVLYQGTDQSKIDELLDQMVREDKEGLMVNLDVPYKCKRHNGILKVKRFYTMDLRIIRCEEGSGRLAGTLGALVLDYKGNEVSVGSGFSDEERMMMWFNRDKLPGLLCEVKYKDVSTDKRTKTESLQFPIYMGLRTDKTEVSYG